VAEWPIDMFCNFYFAKNHNAATKKKPMKLKKYKRKFGILRILEIFVICLTKLKTQII
jgi:hypothetical protein